MAQRDSKWSSKLGAMLWVAPVCLRGRKDTATVGSKAYQRAEEDKGITNKKLMAAERAALVAVAASGSSRARHLPLLSGLPRRRSGALLNTPCSHSGG